MQVYSYKKQRAAQKQGEYQILLEKIPEAPKTRSTEIAELSFCFYFLVTFRAAMCVALLGGEKIKVAP